MTKSKEDEEKTKRTGLVEKSLTIKKASKQRKKVQMDSESRSSNGDLCALLLLSTKDSKCTKEAMKSLTNTGNEKLNEMDVKQ